MLPYVQPMVDNLQPKAIVIALAAYDIYEIAEAAPDLEYLVGLCRRATSKLCLIDMPGWELGFSGPGQTPSDRALVQSQKLRRISLDYLQPACRKIGLPFIDLAARMIEPNTTLKKGMTIDSIHFSEAGLSFFTAAIEEATAMALL